MKKLVFIAITAIAFVACEDDKKKVDTSSEVTEIVEVEEVEKKSIPTAVAKVMEAHGGLATWNKMNNLCFEMDGRAGTEVHTTALKDRRAKIENKNWSIGYDGKDVWLQNHGDKDYAGNARFYHNLMFYFYAMPFVLADDGIVYKELPQRELDGELYNAIEISYNNGVGDSPKDQYILYSNPTTNTMEWLGYTVTYGKEEQSDTFKFIKYDDWQDVNGLQLPRKLTWYNTDENGPTDERNDLVFKKITATATVLEDAVFAMPEGAVVVDK